MVTEQKNWKEYQKDDARLHLFFIKKKTIKRPNKEGLKLFNALNNQYVSTYPRHCVRDSQKFKHLSGLYMDNTVNKELFIEMSAVLNIKKRLIKKAVKDKRLREIVW